LALAKSNARQMPYAWLFSTPQEIWSLSQETMVSTVSGSRSNPSAL
jgi:hypothetical protein